ncbi:MAG: pyridoxal phosphate-dependent decarboxylase family protein [Candidatus Bipolaricaulia bacterium]
MKDQQNARKSDSSKISTWFLGPKAENASLEEKMILHILRDYYYWRRNYYPSDSILVTEQMRREHLDWHDTLAQQINEMLARLKRHFPFYSPRYIGHMLSDQTIPSMLGYFAGMLYNPNNVTPEAAPVTVEWELEVASSILEMLGYNPPPQKSAQASSRQEFGWAHITSGGTIANLEALWVARNIRYFPVAVKQVIQELGFDLKVKLPGSAHRQSLGNLDDYQCLLLKPNETIYMLAGYVDALRRHLDITPEEASSKAWELLERSPLSVTHNGIFSKKLAEWPPVIFVSGAVHYSLEKVADLLGIGKGNMVLVDTDNRFRLDVRDLEHKIRIALQNHQFPLAVIATVGTTEEGAVDPVHQIHDLRLKLEDELGISFWLHIDAAWGGYIRSLFVPDSGGSSLHDRVEALAEFVSRDLEIRDGNYRRRVKLRWGDYDVHSAFLAFPQAESIVVDPHKLGYIPYPCGVVAFRNDRVRHFITQIAPYITVIREENVEVQVHEPPSTVGPFILEGSKPGATAASCWLSHKLIPPRIEGYGEIVRSSLLAARELFTRLVNWEHVCKANWTDTQYRFFPITDTPPDTNILCFLVKEKTTRSLKRTNRLNELIYKRFTIQAELGERDYSYAQPFFLSRTRFHAPNYARKSIADLFKRADIRMDEYEKEGLFVLRATVMTPYITFAAECGHTKDYLAEFVETLAKVAEDVISELNDSYPD